jgi:hypothetical protein
MMAHSGRRSVAMPRPVPDHAFAVVSERVGALSGHQGGKMADNLYRSGAFVKNVGEKAHGWIKVVGHGGKVGWVSQVGPKTLKP